MLHAVANAHSFTAKTAEHAALKQTGSLAHRPGSSLNTVGTSIVSQLLLVGLEPFPVNVARMKVRHHELPLLHRQLDLRDAAAGPVASAGSSIDKRAGVSRIM